MPTCTTTTSSQLFPQLCHVIDCRLNALTFIMMDSFDSDRYTIQPIDRWNSTFFPVNQHNPLQPPFIAPGEIPQEPEVDKLDW